MDWTLFHYAMAVGALIYAISDLRPLVGRQHMFGAEINLGVVALSHLARILAGSAYPVLWFSPIDAVAVSLYANIMFRKKAIWAAMCVILHTAMLILHPLYFVFGRVNASFYLWGLGVLSFLVALTIIIGTAAGRHEFGRRWDDFFANRLLGWSWSGTFATRLSAYKEKVG